MTVKLNFNNSTKTQRWDYFNKISYPQEKWQMLNGGLENGGWRIGKGRCV